MPYWFNHYDTRDNLGLTDICAWNVHGTSQRNDDRHGAADAADGDADDDDGGDTYTRDHGSCYGFKRYDFFRYFVRGYGDAKLR